MAKPNEQVYFLPSWLRGWERFWFTPMDPTILALIRVLSGLILAYSFFTYSFCLQDFFGEHAWYDMQFRREMVDDYPGSTAKLSWTVAGDLPMAETEFQRLYFGQYMEKWNFPPPPPYPRSVEEAKKIDDFIVKYKVDVRINGLIPPQDPVGWDYIEAYIKTHNTPPPAVELDPVKSLEIDSYIKRFNVDPRITYSRGSPLFSLWLHVTDPTSMAVIHGITMFVCVCYTIGFCTRFANAALWFLSLSYIQRNPTVLFGVDTMTTIILFYLMISPCGAVYSVDRWLSQWWVANKVRIQTKWYALFGWQVPPTAVAPAVAPSVEPTIAANVAIRLLQIHVCVIYLLAGISKLQGQTWWNGTAIWLSMSNYELAPMQSRIYLAFLRFLGQSQILFNGFMTFGGYFTLAFEVGYAFMIWQPRLRWVMLAAAILLHGFIGLFMGLQSFSLIMLVMNAAFLYKSEVEWFAVKLRLKRPNP